MKKIFFKLSATLLAICAALVAAGAVYAIVVGRSVAEIFSAFATADHILLIVCALAIVSGFLWLILAPSRQKWNVRQLVVGALCLALSFVLSYIKLFELPQGGSITPASMLPIILFSYIYGARKGVILGLAYGLLSLMQGAYIIHWAQFLLDYICSFAVLGLGGIARRHIAGSVLIAAAGRFVFSVLSGTIFFAEFAGEQGAFWYSVVYNGSYLLPEAAICILVTLIPAVNRMIELFKKQYRAS